MEALVLLTSDFLKDSRHSCPYRAIRRLQSNREHMMNLSRESQDQKLKVLQHTRLKESRHPLHSSAVSM